MLINGDKYGGVGKDSRLLAGVCGQLRVLLQQSELTDDEKLPVGKRIIRELVTERFAKSTSKKERVLRFCGDIEHQLQCITDVEVFLLVAEAIMIPINGALEDIPSNDREYTEKTAKAYLDELGAKGVGVVISLWDDLGVTGCLNAERVAVVREFTRLRRDIAALPELEANMVLTSFTQEFERRLGQKRKSRAGGSLEDVMSFVFRYYGVRAAHAPEHFKSDIEVDKWIKARDGWLIGISCKRTLRERWKQMSSADRRVLSGFKIKEVWHIMTYDEDLSDDKIVTLGEQGHILYLREDSRKLKNAAGHVGMKDYVRPLGRLVSDLKAEQGH
jgi:hypothetical protein